MGQAARWELYSPSAELRQVMCYREWTAAPWQPVLYRYRSEMLKWMNAGYVYIPVRWCDLQLLMSSRVGQVSRQS